MLGFEDIGKYARILRKCGQTASTRSRVVQFTVIRAFRGLGRKSAAVAAPVAVPRKIEKGTSGHPAFMITAVFEG